jgi:hypothetical protein
MNHELISGITKPSTICSHARADPAGHKRCFTLAVAGMPAHLVNIVQQTNRHENQTVPSLLFGDAIQLLPGVHRDFRCVV